MTEGDIRNSWVMEKKGKGNENCETQRINTSKIRVCFQTEPIGRMRSEWAAVFNIWSVFYSVATIWKYW